MQIYITGRHFEITDDIRTYIEKRAKKIETIYNRIIDLQVVIELERNRYLVEITLITRKATFHAQSQLHEIFICLDDVIDKIEKQIRRHKERIKDWRHRLSQRDAAVQLNEKGEEMEEAFEVEAPPDTPISLFRAPEKFALKPMTPEEAAMQLRTSGDSLLLFMNAQTNQINVVYDDESGEYGWIEPRF
jgi:putative sigma-54 modulation protein